jgi:hypothetical protein
VLKAMRETRFDTMGVSRSYLDFYLVCYSLSVAELMLGVLLWQLAERGATARSGHEPAARC